MAGSLEECLKLLKGSNDEQRLVGLLLATKFVSGGDVEAVRQVFEAVGMEFINRLIKTGTGQVAHPVSDKGHQQGYLLLALTVFAAFSRLPGLAASEEFVEKVGVLVATLGSKDHEAAFGDCFESLLSIAGASERGLKAVYEAQTMVTITKSLGNASSDAPWVQAALCLLSFLVQSHPNKSELGTHAPDLVAVVPVVAKQLASLQDLRKFEALAFLRTLLSSDFSMTFTESLKKGLRDSEWATDVRSGLGQILHSRVVPEQKNASLELAEAVVEVVGSGWLLGPMSPPQEGKQPAQFRFFRVIVETVKVETQVVLNEVAPILFESEGAASQQSPETARKLHALATYYALLEHIINIISDEAAEGNQLSESLLEKTVTSLNDVIGVVLQLLEGGQNRGIIRGDIFLASVRLVGRYLGEAPAAHNHRVLKLLGYLVSVTTEGEDRPLHAVSFMLPALSHITMDVEGCTVLISCGAHKQIVSFLQTAIENVRNAPGGIIVGAADVLLNLFVKKGEMSIRLNAGDFIPVLPAMASWAGQRVSKMEVALAGTVSVLVLGLTSESEIHGVLPADTFHTVINLIVLNVEACVQAEDTSESLDEEDLWDITVSGCASCLVQYPSLKNRILSSGIVKDHIVSRASSHKLNTTKPALQMLLASLSDT